MTDHVSQVEFESFGPIKKGTLKLTRLHALIGPNDSGKSVTLRALALTDGLPPHRSKWAAEESLLVGSARVIVSRGSPEQCFSLYGNERVWNNFARSIEEARLDRAPLEWSGCRRLRLDPDEMRKATPLLTEQQPLDFANDRGAGLGAVLDAVFSRNPQHFFQLQSRLTALFPSIAGLRMFTTAEGRQAGVRLVDGSEVTAQNLSEGILYFLAFAVQPYLRPVTMFLVEEPENGLHPSRIREVVGVLREISKTTQVVMATHSPLVVNELHPDEVTLVTRTPEYGTKFTPIAETPNFKKRSEVYALGELWLSYADGKTEEPLLAPTGSR